MCLFVKNNKVKIAKEDIICYKVLKYLKSSHSPTGTVLCTPFADQIISESVLNGDFDFEAVGTPKIEQEYDNEYSISEGYIHTCADKDSANTIYLQCAYYHEYYCANKFEIYECIIPKGTRYYEGVYNHEKRISRASYASEKIRFVKKLDINNL
jgi:hypothetical protein